MRGKACPRSGNSYIKCPKCIWKVNENHILYTRMLNYTAKILFNVRNVSLVEKINPSQIAYGRTYWW